VRSARTALGASSRNNSGILLVTAGSRRERSRRRVHVDDSDDVDDGVEADAMGTWTKETAIANCTKQFCTVLYWIVSQGDVCAAMHRFDESEIICGGSMILDIVFVGDITAHLVLK